MGLRRLRSAVLIRVERVCTRDRREPTTAGGRAAVKSRRERRSCCSSRTNNSPGTLESLRSTKMVVVDASAVSDTASSFGGLEQMLPFRGGLTPEELAARQQRRLEQQRRQTKINAAGARAKTQMAERGALDQERRNSLFDADDFKASFEAKEASMQRTYRELYKPKANALASAICRQVVHIRLRRHGAAAACVDRRWAAPSRRSARAGALPPARRCRRQHRPLAYAGPAPRAFAALPQALPRHGTTPRSRRRSPPSWIVTKAPTRRATRRRRASLPRRRRRDLRPVWRRRSPSTASRRGRQSRRYRVESAWRLGCATSSPATSSSSAPSDAEPPPQSSPTPRSTNLLGGGVPGSSPAPPPATRCRRRRGCGGGDKVRHHPPAAARRSVARAGDARRGDCSSRENEIAHAATASSASGSGRRTTSTLRQTSRPRRLRDGPAEDSGVITTRRMPRRGRRVRRAVDAGSKQDPREFAAQARACRHNAANGACHAASSR